MLTPVGMSVFKNYFFAFVWLQSWGPLYAILNRMMLNDAESDMTAVADMGATQGISMVAQAGIRAVEADIAVSAGYMSASIPFIALLLIKGGIHYATHLASSYLAVGQSAAGEAAREGTTGNISLGNTTQDAHSFFNTSGFQNNQSLVNDGGTGMTRMADGSVLRSNADGSMTSDAAFARQNTLTTMNAAEARSGQLRESASEAQRLSENQSVEASSHLGTAVDNGTAFHENLRNEDSSSKVWSTGMNADQRKSYQDFIQHAKDYADRNSLSEEGAVQAFGAASVGLSWGDNGFKGETSLKGGVTSQEQYEEAQKYVEQHGLAEDYAKSLSAGKTLSSMTGDSSYEALSESYSANMTEGHQLRESAQANYERSQALTREADYVESNAATINQDITGKIFEHGLQQPSSTPGVSLTAGEVARIMNSSDLSDQKIVKGWTDAVMDQQFPSGLNTMVDPSGNKDAAFAGVGSSGPDIGGAFTTSQNDVRSRGDGLVQPDGAVIKEDADTIIDNTGAAISQGQQNAESWTNDMKEIEQRSQESARSVGAEKLEDLSDEAVQYARDNGPVAVDYAKDKASDVVDNIKDKASDVVDNAKDKASDVVDNIKDKASDLVDNAKDKASDLVDYARDFVGGEKPVSSGGGVSQTQSDDGSRQVQGEVETVRNNLEDMRSDINRVAAASESRPDMGKAAQKMGPEPGKPGGKR